MMSEPDLPADVGRWPRDPFQLLRVPRDASPGDLKRAYLALIRRYKPEHAPEAFRRIREAYEAASARRQVISFSLPDTWDEMDVRPAGNELHSEAVDPADAPASTRSAPPARELWARAAEGDEEGAYRQLAAFAQRTAPASATVLQLYWLLTLRPELDTTQKPTDWLLLGLRGPSASWEVVELLRRETARDPGLLLSERFDVLRAPGASPDLVLAVIEGRWKAARAARRWNVILADVEALRSWMSAADESAWCRALVAAARQLIWSEGKEREFARSFSREVDKHYHLTRDLADELIELDFGRALVTGWSALRTEFSLVRVLRSNMERLADVVLDRKMNRNLRTLLPYSWDAPYSDYRALHRIHLADVVSQPLRALEFFDRVYAESKPVVGYLSTLLDRRRSAEPAARAPLDATEITGAVLDFLASNPSWQYPLLRPAILQFCRREATSPEAFVRVVSTHVRIARAPGQELARAIEADRVLDYVCACCHTAID